MFAQGIAAPGVSKETCLHNGMTDKAWIYYTNNSNYVTIGDLFTKIGAQIICEHKTCGLEGKKACGERMRADVALGRLQLVLYGKRSSKMGSTDHQDFDYWNRNLHDSYLTPSECEAHLRALGTKEGVDLLAKCKYCCTGAKPVSAAKLALDVTGNLEEATKFVLREQALVGMDPDLEELTEEWSHRAKEHEKRKAEKKKQETEQRKAEKRGCDSEETDKGAKRAKASR